MIINHILKKGKKNFLQKFKDFIGYQKNVLEVGCGTANYQTTSH